MNILFIGDPHLKISIFSTSKKFLEWIEAVVEEHDIDLVVNLGDTFDTHAVVRSEILSEFRSHVLRLLDSSNVEYVYLLGNHDMYKPTDSSYHALQAVKGMHERFHVIDKCATVHGMTFVPYQPNSADFPDRCENICIAHQTFVGADYGGYKPEYGVDADSVDTEIIISGHIHKRQSFGKVVYPGTPFAQSMRDVDQSKGLMLFDTSNYSYSFIESPFPIWRSINIVVSDYDTVDDMHSDIAGALNEKDHWILNIQGPRSSISSYLDSDNWSNLQKQYRISVRSEYTDKSKIEKKSIRSYSINDIVAEYIDSVYVGNAPKDALKERVMQIVNNTD